MYGSINVFIWNCDRCRLGNWFVARSQVRSPEYRWRVRRVMEEAKMMLLAVVVIIVAAAAIFTGIDVFLALKTARGRKPSNIDGEYDE